MPGLYAKYHVTKADGKPIEAPCFVLVPSKDRAAQVALAAYAWATDDHELRRDLMCWLDRLECLHSRGE